MCVMLGEYTSKFDNLLTCEVSDANMFGGPIPATDQNQYNKVSGDVKSRQQQDKLVCPFLFNQTLIR